MTEVATLKEFVSQIKASEERESFAARCGTTWQYMQHIINDRRNPSATLAISIERETSGMVRAETLCPDADWAYIRATKEVAA